MGRYILDRFEDGLAYLENPDGSFQSVDQSLIEQGAKQGDVLLEKDGFFTVDQEATQLRQKQIQSLFERVTKKRGR